MKTSTAWKSAPISATCEVIRKWDNANNRIKEQCDKPTEYCYPAMGGGYMALCARHGQRHLTPGSGTEKAVDVDCGRRDVEVSAIGHRHPDNMRSTEEFQKRADKAVKNCRVCGVLLGWHKSKFCSTACSQEGMRRFAAARFVRSETVEKACRKCGSMFTHYGHVHFCGKQCRESFFNEARLVNRDARSKQCKKCGHGFTISELNTRQVFCSEKCSRRDYKNRHKTRLSRKRLASRKMRYATDPDYRNRVRKASVRSVLKRYSSDPVFRIKMNLRKRIRTAIKHRTRSVSELLGCSGLQLREHLESRFSQGMEWSNYGTFWVVDHKTPLAAFNLSVEAHQKAACHFTNLQPLTRIENQEKSDKILEPHLLLHRSWINEPAPTPSDNRVACNTQP